MKTINVLNTKKFSPYQIKSYLAILEILGAFTLAHKSNSHVPKVHNSGV